MLKLSAKTEYALLLVRHLKDCQTPRSIASISSAINISEPLLRKVAQRLVSQWICASEKWRTWWIFLVQKSLSLFDVLSAMEEDMGVVLCAGRTGGKPCWLESECSISPLLKRLQKWVQSLLKIIRI